MTELMKDIPEWTEHPFLIYGPRKAGTTLLLNLLDGSEHFFVYPGEIKLKKFLVAREQGTVSGAEAAGLLTAGLDRCEAGMDMPGYQRALSQLATARVTNLRDVLRFLAFSLYQNLNSKPSAVKAWGLKEVGGDTESIVGLLRSHFFGAKIVLIMRDPYFVTRSVLRDRRRKGLKLSLRKKIKEIIDPVRTLYAQVKLLGDEHVHATTYEYITGGKLEEEMRALCAFLGSPYAEIHEQPTVLRESSVVATSSRETTEVFKEEKRWTDGLTWCEQVLVRSVHLLLRVYLATTGRRYIPYAEAVSQIYMQRPTRAQVKA